MLILLVVFSPVILTAAMSVLAQATQAVVAMGGAK